MKNRRSLTSTVIVPRDESQNTQLRQNRPVLLGGEAGRPTHQARSPPLGEGVFLLSGGILISCSCSHFFDAEHFYGMLNNAAGDAKRRIQFLEKRGAGPDHPVLSGYERSEYLKCAVMRVL